MVHTTPNIPDRIVSLFILFAFVAIVGCGDESTEELTSHQSTSQQGHDFPRRPIKLIVPFGAGGGSDTFGRIIQKAVEENQLLQQPLVIVNVPGAGGTIGSRRVKNAEPDGYTLLLLHEGILTAKHSGQATWGPDAFTPVAGTGGASQVIAVAGDSPFQNLKSLMDAASQRPDSIVFSANIGAPSQFAGLMLEAEQPGAKFRFTQNGGGAKRFAALQGGHADVSSFSFAEYVQFRESGVRALAVLAEERDSDFPDLQTAREQGFDVISQNMQFWWAPAGTPSERIDLIADALAKAMKTTEVQERLSEMKIRQIMLTGSELDDEIARRDRRIGAVATSSAPQLPNFPAIVLSVFGCLLVLAWYRARTRKNSSTGTGNTSSSASFTIPAVLACVTLAYVATFEFRVMSFVPATAIYVLLTCLLLRWKHEGLSTQSLPKATLVACGVALMMSYAMNTLFTHVLFVDLP